MQGERAGVGVAIVRIHLSDRCRVRRAISVEQFARLPLQLFEVGTLAQNANGKGSAHGEVLSLQRPVAARAGKEG